LLQDKRIVVGICGGIAAYKSADLVSRLRKKGAQVRVIMTDKAQEFITPLTLRTISGYKVATDMFSCPQEWEIQHISLAQWAEYIVIAPATANLIGKVASGIADDLLTATVMATRATVVIVPAMNTNMYNNPIVQRNIQSLTRDGYLFFGPAKGSLACGDEGDGRMEEPSAIVEYLESLAAQKRDFENRTVLVTAGPTREALDPVRFLTNASSGKMGYSVARAAARRGARVILISGPTDIEPPPSVELVPVVTALDMYEKVMQYFPDCDVVIKTAAVSDYRPAVYSGEKIKKTEGRFTIEMVRNPDILAELGRKKKGQILVGFAAESANVIDYARDKLKSKNLDLVVANDITREGAGFAGDTNQGYLLDAKGGIQQLPAMTKDRMAEIILDKVAQLLGKDS
jgi:phosphopantothenoylcysteine decarboxylase/phosphopantothenate--cysteine ligase